MMHLKPLIRRARTLLWYVFVLTVTTAAVLVTLARLLLPEVQAYRESVERWASAYLGQQVRIAALDARLRGLSPTLRLQGVQLLAADGEQVLLDFDEARVELDLLGSLRRMQPVPASLTVAGLQLGITRQPSGELLVHGPDAAALSASLGEGGDSSQLAEWLFSRASLRIAESELVWHDLKRGGSAMHFSDVNVSLANRGGRHLFDLEVSLPREAGRRLRASADVTGDVQNPATWEGRFHVQAEQLQLANLGLSVEAPGLAVERGQLDLLAWGEWKDGHLASMSGAASAERLELYAPPTQVRERVERLAGRFHWQQDANGWQLDVGHFQFARAGRSWPDSRARLTQRHEGGETGLRLQADFVRLEDVTALLALAPLEGQWREALTTVQPRGEIRALDAAVRDPTGPAPELHLRARFTDLALRAWGKLPAATGLGGSVAVHGNQGVLRLDSQAASLEFPGLFRAPLGLSRLQGELSWQREAGGWRVEGREVQADSPHVATRSDVLVLIPADGSSPHLDLQVAFRDGQAAHVARYLPVGIMGAPLVEWLDRAFVAGRVPRGGAVFNGRLGDFPFDAAQGRFQVAFTTEDVTLDYQPGWPRLDRLAGDVRFTGQGMAIEVASGRLLDSRIEGARVKIADFRAPVLAIQGEVAGQTADAVRFLSRSPIAAASRSTLESLAISGASRTQLGLYIPLTAAMAERAPLRYAGNVSLSDSAVALGEGGLGLSRINGRLEFDESSRRASGITAEVLGEPAVFDIYTPFRNPNANTLVVARGGFDTARAQEAVDEPLWQGRLEGRTDWQGLLTLHHDSAADARVQLRVTSDLAGLAVDLPAPLSKPADEVRPLLLELELSGERYVAHVDYADTLSTVAQVRAAGERVHVERAAVQFGGGPVVLPDSNRLRLGGQLNAVDLADWRLMLGGGAGAPALVLPRPIEVDLERLELMTSEEEGETDAPQAITGVAPQDIPTLAGRIRDVVLNGASLGELRLNVEQAARGLYLREFRLQGPHAALTASGEWLYDGMRHHTAVEARLTSGDFGRFLRDLQFAPGLRGGEGEVRAQVHWPDTPMAMPVEKMQGRLNVAVKDGTIAEVDPGAGRLVGLLSLQALPRRLALDFSDVFKKGLKFDTLQGSFALQAGDAVTNDLLLKGPSVRLLAQGRSGLVAEDFDHLVTVIPSVGDTLPVAGGLALGTQAGALILLFQRLFKSEIDKLAQYQYRITGSWDDPVITRLARPEPPDDEWS